MAADQKVIELLEADTSVHLLDMVSCWLLWHQLPKWISSSRCLVLWSYFITQMNHGNV